MREILKVTCICFASLLSILLIEIIDLQVDEHTLVGLITIFSYMGTMIGLTAILVKFIEDIFEESKKRAQR